MADEWRGPRDRDDPTIGAQDGTRWQYEPRTDTWRRRVPYEPNAVERLTPAEMGLHHPEVVAENTRRGGVTVHLLDRGVSPLSQCCGLSLQELPAWDHFTVVHGDGAITCAVR